MNTITYQNQEFTVPAWARFIAADGDRRVYVYSHAPSLDMDDFHGDAYAYVLDVPKSVMQEAGRLVHAKHDVPYPIEEIGEKTNPVVEALIAAIHNGSIKVATLVAPPDDEERFFVGDLIRFKGRVFLTHITEIHLREDGRVQYATAVSAWHKGSDFELVARSSAKTRRDGGIELLGAQDDEEEV